MNIEERKAKNAEYARKWRLANPEKVKANNAKYRNDPIRKAEAVKRASEWRLKNLERSKAWYKDYYEKTREIQISKSVDWQKKNPEKVSIRNANYKARKKFNGGKLSIGIVDSLMGLQMGKCACCKIKITKENRHLDHIVSLKEGGANVDSNVQLLCASCNCSKRAKNPIEFMQSRGYLL